MTDCSDLSYMRRLETLEDGAHDGQGLGGRERALARQPVPQRLALDKLHGDEPEAVGFTDVERPHDVRMGDTSRHEDFLPQP